MSVSHLPVAHSSIVRGLERLPRRGEGTPSSPGRIDPRTGVIRQATNLGWLDLAIRQLLATRYR